MQVGQGHFLWAIGGKHELGQAVNDVTVYNIDQDQWYSSGNDDLAPMSYGVQGAGWSIFENKIYCFGGKTSFHRGCSDYVQVYDIAANQWTVLEEMPAARSKLGKFYPVVAQRYIYLFGGDSSKGQYSRVNWNWRFDLKKHKWKTGVADAPFVQSFPLPTYHRGWLYYSTGNTGQSPLHRYPGSLNQRYHPEQDRWQVLKPCPVPVTDGEGDKWQGELHFLGGWNANPVYYNPSLRRRFKGRVKRLHLIYNYDRDEWRFGPKLPGRWHHGGSKAAAGYLWRYLGTIDEDINLKTNLMRFTQSGFHKEQQHTNRIFRWDGQSWEEKNSAPVRKMNFSCVYSQLGPVVAE